MIGSSGEDFLIINVIDSKALLRQGFFVDSKKMFSFLFHDMIFTKNSFQSTMFYVKLRKNEQTRYFGICSFFFYGLSTLAEVFFTAHRNLQPLQTTHYSCFRLEPPVKCEKTNCLS